jgi:shikimate dehydrogenase
MRFLVGLIGSGIRASGSPALHENEGRELGLQVHYQLIDLDTLDWAGKPLPEILRAAETMGFAGVNVTHPCKQAVIPFLDELSDDVRAIGAVNTVVFSGGRRIGHNTDWYVGRAAPGDRR